MRQTFRPGDRIRKRRDFVKAYEAGVRQHGRFMTIFVRPNALPAPRLGVSATKKLGSAVVRNRAKRRARELFRRARPALGVDLVIIPRREFVSAPYDQLEADYHAAVRKGIARSRARAGAGDAG
jgi:ribonuclease P protein component